MTPVNLALLEFSVNNINRGFQILEDELINNPSNSWARLELVKAHIKYKNDNCCDDLISEGFAIGKDVHNLYAAKSSLLMHRGLELDALNQLYSGWECCKNSPHALNFLFDFLIKNKKTHKFSQLVDDVFRSDVPQHVVDNCMFHVLPHLNLKKISIDNLNKSWNSIISSKKIDAVIVMLIKDEGDIIFHNIKHHYDMGFRYFFLMNNMSSDDTLAQIEKATMLFKDSIIVNIYDPIVEHLQGAKTTILAQYAKSYLSIINIYPRWLLALDADEFIDSRSDFANVIDNIPDSAKILVFTLRNIAPTKVFDALDSNCNIYDLFTLFDNSHIYQNPVVKIAIKSDQDPFFAEGNHYVNNCITNPSDIFFLMDYGVILNHLPVRSVSQIKRKTVNGSRSMANLPGGGHWKQRKKLYDLNGDSYFVKLIENTINSIKNSM